MKNITWRRVAMILGLVVIGFITFGVGYITGTTQAAEFMIDQVVRVIGYENITIDINRIELLQYYRRLKGGA